MKSTEKREKIFRPEKMDLGHNELLLWKDKKDETPCAALPYREMLFVYLERKTEVKGVVQIPPVEEITGEMEGNLVIWNRTHRCIRLDLSSQKETAGALFIRLAEHIPFAFLGATPWMQVENEKDFRRCKNGGSVSRNPWGNLFVMWRRKSRLPFDVERK